MGLRWISFRIWTWWVPPVWALQGGRLSASQHGSLAYLQSQGRLTLPTAAALASLPTPVCRNYPTRYSHPSDRWKHHCILLSSACPQLLQSTFRPFKCHPNNPSCHCTPNLSIFQEIIHSSPALSTDITQSLPGTGHSPSHCSSITSTAARSVTSWSSLSLSIWVASWSTGNLWAY